jgi:hypothetical protein
VQAVLEIDEGPFLPDLLAQLLVGNDLARMRQQAQQNLKWLAGQTDADTALEQLTRRNAYLIGSEGEASRGLRLGRHRGFADGQPTSLHGNDCDEVGGQVSKSKPAFRRASYEIDQDFDYWRIRRRQPARWVGYRTTRLTL